MPATKIAPGETKDVSVATTLLFRPERIIIAEPSRSKIRIGLAFLRNLPIALLENLLGLFNDRGCPGWRPPRYFPMSITSIKIGTTDQFRPNTSLPAEIFCPEALDPHLRFDTCQINQPLTITVRSHAKQAILFRAGIIGTALE